MNGALFTYPPLASNVKFAQVFSRVEQLLFVRSVVLDLLVVFWYKSNNPRELSWLCALPVPRPCSVV